MSLRRSLTAFRASVALAAFAALGAGVAASAAASPAPPPPGAQPPVGAPAAPAAPAPATPPAPAPPPVVTPDTGSAAPTAPATPAPSGCTIVGTAGDDRLVGTSRRDVICGLGGDDRLVGRGGRDVLVGGPGDDTFVARDGRRDVVSGGPGVDRIVSRDRADRVGSVEPPSRRESSLLNPTVLSTICTPGYLYGTVHGGTDRFDGDYISRRVTLWAWLYDVSTAAWGWKDVSTTGWSEYQYINGRDSLPQFWFTLNSGYYVATTAEFYNYWDGSYANRAERINVYGGYDGNAFCLS